MRLIVILSNQKVTSANVALSYAFRILKSRDGWKLRIPVYAIHVGDSCIEKRMKERRGHKGC